MRLLDLLVVLQKGNKHTMISLFEKRGLTVNPIKTTGILFDNLKDYLNRKVDSLDAMSEGLLRVTLVKEEQ